MLYPVMEKKLAANIQASRTMSIIRSSDVVFEVQCSDTSTYLVDLSRHFCEITRGGE